MQFLKRYKWIIGGAGLVVVVLAFLAFRPDKLFVDDVVDESLDDAFAAEVVDDSTETTSTTTTTTTQAPTTTEGTGGDTTTTVPETTTTTEAAGPIATVSGSFDGVGRYSAEGTATVYELDGQFVLRFEDDTDIQNAPDLFVYVLEAPSYDGGDPGEFINLGKIKGNVGGQNYELPAEYDPTIHQSVLIWCQRFTTPVATAPLA